MSDGNHAGTLYVKNPKQVLGAAEGTDQPRPLVDAMAYAAESGGIEMGDTPLTANEEVVFSWALQLGRALALEEQGIEKETPDDLEIVKEQGNGA
jgi:hypothetical protein